MSALFIAIVVVPMAASCLFAVALARVAGRADDQVDVIRMELYRKAGKGPMAAPAFGIGESSPLTHAAVTDTAA